MTKHVFEQMSPSEFCTVLRVANFASLEGSHIGIQVLEHILVLGMYSIVFSMSELVEKDTLFVILGHLEPKLQYF